MPSTSRTNMRVLVTRPVEDADRTAALLAAHGHEAVLAPLFEIRRLGAVIPAGADAVLAASANALRMADPTALERLSAAPLLAVGGQTAETAQRLGFRDVAAGEGDGTALATLVRARIEPGATLLHLAGRPRRDEAIRSLADAYRLIIVETYETIAARVLPAAAAEALRSGAVDAVLHLSPRAARVFADLSEKAGLLEPAQRLLHVFISKAAADPRLLRSRIAARPDLETVISAL